MKYRRTKNKTSLAPLVFTSLFFVLGVSAVVWAGYKNSQNQKNIVAADTRSASSISVVLSKRTVSTPLFTMDLTNDWQLNEQNLEEGEFYHYMKTERGTITKHIKIATSEPRDLRVTRVLPAEITSNGFRGFGQVSDHCGETELTVLPSINYLCYHDGTRFSLKVIDESTSQSPEFGSYINPKTLHIYFIDYNEDPSSNELERILSSFKAKQ